MKVSKSDNFYSSLFLGMALLGWILTVGYLLNNPPDNELEWGVFIYLLGSTGTYYWLNVKGKEKETDG